MSYQVLARKWRPRIFSEMVGQEHVLKALINALDHDRLHHAYLFTGTRGVGKTTVARILARCLNCETGVGSSPCGVCSTCIEINEGRFVDLIEVDAASRTKVEDTRELLDNVQYLPTSGRYKIYLIDEVHMLSNSSFNALLKTLEEPPSHVKFLLATTDPQKLPATILSRCLQFNLKNMSSEKIVAHLQHVLAEEMVPFADGALWQLARAADGSMRDALSLTDQAIAFGNGKLNDSDVAIMLGSIDHRFTQSLVQALIAEDGAALLKAVAQFAEHAPDYASALADLQTQLHRIAIAQALPSALDNSYGDKEQILEFARQLAPEDVQLFYQMALMGQRDLKHSVIARTGFEMTLLRMLAFKPQGLVDVPTQILPAAAATAVSSELASQTAAAPVNSTPTPAHSTPVNSAQALTENAIESADAVEALSLSNTPALDKPAPEVETASPNEPFDDAPPWRDDQVPVDNNSDIDAEGESLKKPQAEADPQSNVSAPRTLTPNTLDSVPSDTAVPPAVEEVSLPVGEVDLSDVQAESASNAHSVETIISNKAAVTTAEAELTRIEFSAFEPSAWISLFQQLDISGVLKLTASNLSCIEKHDGILVFAQDELNGGLLNTEHAVSLGDALSRYFDVPVKAQITLAALDDNIETPAQWRVRKQAERRATALASMKADTVVQTLEQQFAAVLDEASLQLHEH